MIENVIRPVPDGDGGGDDGDRCCTRWYDRNCDDSCCFIM